MLVVMHAFKFSTAGSNGTEHGGRCQRLKVPGTRCLRRDFTTGVIAEAGFRTAIGAWHLSAIRSPIVKSGRANPVPGTYATGTSYRVQFSWHLTP